MNLDLQEIKLKNGFMDIEITKIDNGYLISWWQKEEDDSDSSHRFVAKNIDEVLAKTKKLLE